MARQILVLTTLVLASISCLTMTSAADKKKPTAREDKPVAPGTDTGLARDLQLLRKTEDLVKPRLRASSEDACEAAARVFARLRFIGMRKTHVLWVLGDPATISDYGFKVGPEVDAPLIYRFSQGDDGHDY